MASLLEKLSEATLKASDAELPLAENPELGASEVGAGNHLDGHKQDQTVNMNDEALSKANFLGNSGLGKISTHINSN